MDEQFQGEDTVDETFSNATQRRMEEEGTIWHEVGPNAGEPTTNPEAEQEAEHEV